VLSSLPSLPSRMLDRANAWSPFVIALSVFLLLRPYDGIVHDARLYVGYVLAAWDPQGVGQDIVFVHDGQSGYSIYPALLNLVGRTIGLAKGAMVLSMTALLLWFSAAWRLVWAMFPAMGTTVRAGLLLWATSLHTLYGGASTIHFAENFAAPRPMAEALVLLAMAELLQPKLARQGASYSLRQLGVVGLLIALAAAIHPLMIVPGLAAFVWLVPTARWRALLAGSGAVVLALVLCVSGFSPQGPDTGSLFATFDAVWLEILVRRGSIALLSQWSGVDWARIALQFATLLLARPTVSGRVRALWDATLVAGVAGVLLSWLATDVFHHRLLTQIQPWRVLWAVAFMAPIALLMQVRGLWERSITSARPPEEGPIRLERLAMALLLLAWFMLEVSGAALWVLAGAAMLLGVARSNLSIALGDRTVRVGLGLIGMLVVLLVVLRAFVVWEVYASHPDALSRWVWRTWVTSGLPNAAVLIVALLAACIGARPVRAVVRMAKPMPAVAVMVAVLCVLALDQRTSYAKWLDAQTERPSTLNQVLQNVSSSATVFWLDADTEPWVLLNRPAWGGGLQGTPKVFDRALAVVWEERAQLTDKVTHPTWARRNDLALETVNAATLRTICDWPSGPDMVVAPLDRIGADVPRDTMRTGAPRFLPPSVRKGPWQIITAYGVVRCAERAGFRRAS